MSKKRAREKQEYLSLRKLFLEDKKTCEAQVIRCTLKATDVHHKQGRISNLYLDVSKWLAVCRSCHEWIENNPKKAIELGFSLSRYGPI